MVFDNIEKEWNNFTWQCQNAFTQVGNATVYALNQVGNSFEYACKKIEDEYNYLGRKVEQLTNKHVASPMRQVLQEAYWGAPYTAALLPFAAIGLGAVAAAIALLTIRLFDEAIDAETTQRMYRGIRNFCVLGAGVEVTRSLVTLNPLFLLNVPFYLLLGFVAHENAKYAHAKAV